MRLPILAQSFIHHHISGLHLCSSASQSHLNNVTKNTIIPTLTHHVPPKLVQTSVLQLSPITIHHIPLPVCCCDLYRRNQCRLPPLLLSPSGIIVSRI